jgi:hypothetical protein
MSSGVLFAAHREPQAPKVSQVTAVAKAAS